MDGAQLEELLAAVRDGTVTPDDAVEQLRLLPFADIGDALVDHHRVLRQGLPEVVYGPGKTVAQCLGVVDELLARGSGAVLVTRVTDEQRDALLDGDRRSLATEPFGGSVLLREPPLRDPQPRVVVITAGTSDVPVADEALITLRAYGFHAERVVDVGVAGLHRLLSKIECIMAADAIIVIAGMEGALASVIGGLAGCPVIAVPTSVGYGSSLDGITALLAMHASCAAGVTVVGVDNGFGAATAVARIVSTRGTK